MLHIYALKRIDQVASDENSWQPVRLVRFLAQRLPIPTTLMSCHVAILACSRNSTLSMEIAVE